MTRQNFALLQKILKQRSRGEKFGKRTWICIHAQNVHTRKLSSSKNDIYLMSSDICDIGKNADLERKEKHN